MFVYQTGLNSTAGALGDSLTAPFPNEKYANTHHVGGAVYLKMRLLNNANTE